MAYRHRSSVFVIRNGDHPFSVTANGERSAISVTPNGEHNTFPVNRNGERSAISVTPNGERSEPEGSGRAGETSLEEPAAGPSPRNHVNRRKNERSVTGRHFRP